VIVTVLVVAAPLPLANARGTMDPLDPLYNAPALAGVRRPQKPASELRARAAVGADDEQPTSTRLSLAIVPVGGVGSSCGSVAGSAAPGECLAP
jgi:hypothetical protein